MFEPVSRNYLEQPDALETSVLALWEKEDLFAVLLRAREGGKPFVFYEGPPTANGQPGIHHVLARALKDAVCRFQTMRGRMVLRKAGWDTHGLPVELEVEKKLGINGKPEIEKLGLGEFNRACRDSVFTYKKEWEDLSRRIGYLLDYEHPYVTFHSGYVESVWFLLSRFAAHGMLYRGHKVLPWCGRCGTGLSSHEVGLGYQDVEDPSVWVTFPLREGTGLLAGAALVAWTTTPWTLPSNFAACVNPALEYAVLEHEGRRFVLLEEKIAEVFGEAGGRIAGRVKGAELCGLAYEPLFPGEGLLEIRPGEGEHRVVGDPFVTAEEGTGIVHLAPYGADDFRIAKREGLPVRLAVGEEGRFVVAVGGVPAGTFFKEADKPLRRDLKARGRLLKQASHRHSYPHCWRCDQPLLYLPAPAWFLRTTEFKAEMLEENGRIRWVPPEVGAGRFGEWLENNVDWALSRSRFWGTPLPVWVCDRNEDHWECLGSFAELGERAGGLSEDFDPHRPGVDAFAWACDRPGCGGTRRRVPEVIDCWFDSGAMPFAQYHWPFENRELVARQFPADFICEGIDQTRGWFYTLHAIATFLTRVDARLWKERPELPPLRPGGAYRSCLVNGLLLDAKGVKMSKRLGNRVDPWEAIRKHGSDAIRWSLLSGSAAHLSKRYSDAGIADVRRRFFGTLTSCYGFLALYAGTENWDPAAPAPPIGERPPLDRWILARTGRAAGECVAAWEALEPWRALRALDRLVVEEVSNWYIRRSRRRFWNNADAADQASAFATLYEVLGAVVRHCAPVAPFLSDALWRRLTGSSRSVHLEAHPEEGDFRAADPDGKLQAAMEPILVAASMGRAVRERLGIRVRQPLGRLLVHVADEARLPASPRAYERLLREELNVKEVEWIEGVPDFLEVRARPDYPRLGKRAGKDMKALAAAIAGLDRAAVFGLQEGRTVAVSVGERTYELQAEDVALETLGVEGLEAATDGRVTIGLATEITPALRREGLAREILNRVQTQRREAGLEVTDRIALRISGSPAVAAALREHGGWIAAEALAPGGCLYMEPADARGDSFRNWALAGSEDLRIALEPVRVPAS